MKIATFGKKVFKVSSNSIMTFGAVSRTAGFKVDEQENGKKKPLLKNKGPELETLSFPISLNASFVDVPKEIDSWIKLLGSSYYFIIGNKKYGNNKWELINCDISEQEFTRDGVIKSAQLSLSFKEKVVKTSTKSTAKTTRNTKK